MGYVVQFDLEFDRPAAVALRHEMEGSLRGLGRQRLQAAPLTGMTLLRALADCMPGACACWGRAAAWAWGMVGSKPAAAFAQAPEPLQGSRQQPKAIELERYSSLGCPGCSLLEVASTRHLPTQRFLRTHA